MGELTTARLDHGTDGTGTALHLALPAAVAVHALGALLSQRVIGAAIDRGPAESLGTVLAVISALTTLVVLALCIAALRTDRSAARSGRTRHRGRRLAAWALTAALLVPALHDVLWFSGIGFDVIRHLGLAVSVLGMLLAAVALVAGTAAVASVGPPHHDRAAATVAAIATPAALLTPVIGMAAGSTGGYALAAFSGVALAMVGLVAAAVALRGGGEQAPGTAGTPGTTTPGPAVLGPATTRPPAAVDGRGRRFLRYLATPLAFTALVLAVPSLTVDDDGALTVTALVTAFALAVAAIVAAVLDLRSERRSERRSGGVRMAAHLAAGTIPLAIALVPLAVALAALSGDRSGWAVLGALSVSVPLAAVVALAGLIAAIVAASAGQYPGRVAAASVLCTALAPLALALFVPLQAAGAALASVLLAGFLLLSALVAGLVTVVRAGAATPEVPAPDTQHNPYP